MPLLFVAILALVFIPFTILAQTDSQSVQAQCFDTLKENMGEVDTFASGTEYLEQLSYQDLEPKFSKKYKTLSSFGTSISVDEARFATRLHSFGESTGYIHPPQTIFPDSYRSESWSTTTKQNIVAEEYIIDDSGVEHFIGCFFARMTSADLMAVTADNYTGGVPGMSFLKVAPDQSYKAWYSQTTFLDRATQPSVTWDNMFIYPQKTTNPYFNKYDLAETYPSVGVTGFGFLGLLGQSRSEAREENVNESREQEVTQDVEVEVQQPATPVVPSSAINTFPLAAYFEAVQNEFPEFAKLLSVRGTIKYGTFIEIISNPSPDPEIAKFFNVTFSSPVLQSYFLNKSVAMEGVESISNPELDRLLLLVQNGDWTIQKIKQGSSIDTLVFSLPETEVVSYPATSESPQAHYQYQLIIAVCLSTILIIIYLVRQRKKLI